MVLIGGITRLTHSGLSMVRWEPVTGVIPPLGEDAWISEFEQYKKFPEFQKINRNMTLPEFKRIFFWEYLHRLLGRLTGLVFFIPFMVFIRQKRLSKSLKTRLWIIFLLGGFQGFLGWYMVKSGLADNPDVSHYRLAAHLVTAFILMVYLFWTILWVRAGEPESRHSHFLMPLAQVLTGLVMIQIIYGAFTAGLDAAYGYNTFPLMDGRFLPAGYDLLNPFVNNLVQNRFMVQFIHRTLGWLLLAAGLIWFVTARWKIEEKRILSGSGIFVILLIIQFILGVLTLVFTGKAIPLGFALLHQMTALFLLLSVFNILFHLRYGLKV